MQIEISHVEYHGSISAAIEAKCEASDCIASGVIGPAFSTSGPGSGWSCQYGVRDYAERALADDYGATSYIDSSDGREATLNESGKVVWSEDSEVEIIMPTIDEIVASTASANTLLEQAVEYGADAEECAKLRKVCDLVFAFSDCQGRDDEMDEVATALQAVLDSGVKLSFEVTSDHDWDEDNDEPVCRTCYQLQVFADGDVLLTGEATGYYSYCRSGGEQFSAWQDGDGEEFDNGWKTIEHALEECGIASSDEVREALAGVSPDAPEPPKETEDGAFALLYHGWEQDWSVEGRYATEADANRALIAADRKTTEANSSGAYGWDYAVAEVLGEREDETEDGAIDVDGLCVKIMGEDEGIRI